MKESQTAVERITLGVLIASDKGANGQRQDSCLPVIRQKLSAIGCIVSNYSILPDERPFLAATLREWADKDRLDLIITAGGAGCSPRDVTPEALLEVAERLVPGIPEAMRQASCASSPRAMLSRAYAGIRGRTLIINLPGSPTALAKCLDAILDILPQAICDVRGDLTASSDSLE